MHHPSIKEKGILRATSPPDWVVQIPTLHQNITKIVVGCKNSVFLDDYSVLAVYFRFLRRNLARKKLKFFLFCYGY
jgi:hypothetical protein